MKGTFRDAKSLKVPFTALRSGQSPWIRWVASAGLNVPAGMPVP